MGSLHKNNSTKREATNIHMIMLSGDFSKLLPETEIKKLLHILLGK